MDLNQERTLITYQRRIVSENRFSYYFITTYLLLNN